MPPPAEGFAARLVLGPALRTQPDRRLVALVRDGYETAFEEIVRRYGKPLTRYAAAIVGSRGEDVTQDAFSKALLALRRSEAEIELRPWLFRIVRNTALNELRDRPPSPQALAEAIAGDADPAEALERREELADLIRRLRSLPEPQRAAIVMRELEGLSHEEIAAALGLSGGAARQAIYRARRALRDGFGLLLPLPLLRALADHGGEVAIAGAGGVAAGGALGSVALKAGALTAVLAGSVGAGIALEQRSEGGREGAGVATPRVAASAAPAPPSAPAGGAGAALPYSRSGGTGERVGGNSRANPGPGAEDERDVGSGPPGGDAARELREHNDGDDRRGHGPRAPRDAGEGRVASGDGDRGPRGGGRHGAGEGERGAPDLGGNVSHQGGDGATPRPPRPEEAAEEGDSSGSRPDPADPAPGPVEESSDSGEGRALGESP